LFTGDCLTGEEAVEWGLAIESAPKEQLDVQFESLVQRIAQMPINQLIMMKLLINQETASNGLASTQIMGTVFDGITRHTEEGYEFQRQAAEQGFMAAVKSRDNPFNDFGLTSSQVIKKPTSP
jgi:enoyl-CoA hydratase